eukprot:CAMPEP_0180036218 /NCGR_PEP_ID=MMETSP0984-20121128/30766_1 /TAXON_ID=483367 /ORGANISM="non described non described, Strain CCMP 2436" /LENGTH=54 /DNA_ID=CAMNT_0021962291 /DNA_START=15 /DNA_END=176 /DNA_ORIENTATION=+
MMSTARSPKEGADAIVDDGLGLDEALSDALAAMSPVGGFADGGVADISDDGLER